jgi:CRP-like cAMP-binding protein
MTDPDPRPGKAPGDGIDAVTVDRMAEALEFLQCKQPTMDRAATIAALARIRDRVGEDTEVTIAGEGKTEALAVRHFLAALNETSIGAADVSAVRASTSARHVAAILSRARATEDRGPVNFLRSLTAAEQESFAAVAARQSFAAGTRLMLEGEPPDHVIVIVSGWTRITVRSAGGERTVAERGPGQLVGERAALRRNVRTATVKALTEVTALVTRTEDFASFVSAHPRVLDVVESQIYDRLTEDPEGYAPDGWPGGFPLQIASDALAARRRAQALTGENCTVILTDVVGFGARHRADRHRLIIRREGWLMMQAVLGPLWNSCFAEDRGDGLLVVAPPQIPTARIIEGIHRELPARLAVHNSTYAEPCQFRLRLAVNVGPVTTDPIGMSGKAIIRTARLVEAPPLKKAMAETGHGLGVIVSEFVYETAVDQADRSIDADKYQKVDVSIKEFQSKAWMRLYDLSPLLRDPGTPDSGAVGLQSGSAIAGG